MDKYRVWDQSYGSINDDPRGKLLVHGNAVLDHETAARTYMAMQESVVDNIEVWVWRESTGEFQVFECSTKIVYEHSVKYVDNLLNGYKPS